MQRLFKNPIAVLILVLLAVGPVRVLLTDGVAGMNEWIMDTLYILPGIVVGLSFHEFAHAKVADMCGDRTPRLMGRVTTDPRAHIDPMGLVSLIFIHFGWGKPVMIDPSQFKNGRRDSIFVGLAGVTMNMFIAVLFGGIIALMAHISPDFLTSGFGQILGAILLEVVIINVSLLLFNLLPVPPLDGFGVIADIFGLHNTKFYSFVYQNSMLILLALILLDVPSKLLSTPLVYIVNFIMTNIYHVYGWFVLL